MAAGREAGLSGASAGGDRGGGVAAASVLLVRRGKAPAMGQWSLPGVRSIWGRRRRQAARRELLEETGLAVGPMILAGAVDSIERDAGGRVRFHYTILDFAAVWVAGEPVAGDDAMDARFVAFDGLEAVGLWSEALRIIAAARRLLG